MAVILVVSMTVVVPVLVAVLLARVRH